MSNIDTNVINAVKRQYPDAENINITAYQAGVKCYVKFTQAKNGLTETYKVEVKIPSFEVGEKQVVET